MIRRWNSSENKVCPYCFLSSKPAKISLDVLCAFISSEMILNAYLPATSRWPVDCFLSRLRFPWGSGRLSEQLFSVLPPETIFFTTNKIGRVEIWFFSYFIYPFFSPWNNEGDNRTLMTKKKNKEANRKRMMTLLKYDIVFFSRISHRPWKFLHRQR